MKFTHYIKRGFGFTVGQDFARASAPLALEIAPTEHAQAGYTVGYIAENPKSSLRFLRIGHEGKVRVHVQLSALGEGFVPTIAAEVAELTKHAEETAKTEPQACGEYTLKAHTCETVALLSYDADGKKNRKGFLLTFAAYPGIPLFLVKSRVNTYHRIDLQTGLKFDSNLGERTRTQTIRSTWDLLERMRQTTRHGGSHESVARFVEECRARFRASQAATGGTAQ